jgi:hypothetical protein
VTRCVGSFNTFIGFSELLSSVSIELGRDADTSISLTHFGIGLGFPVT